MLKTNKSIKTKVVGRQSIAFWSPFSDGSTTCAIEYAKALSKQYDANVALVELDMLHPSFEIYFPSNTGGFKEILRADRIDRITFENIKNAAIQNDFDVYKNYFSYIDLFNINMTIMEKVLTMIISMYDFVIFDTNRNFDNKLTDLALRLSDRVIIPIKPSPLEIDLLNKYLDIFEDHQEWSVLKCAALINQYQANHPTYLDIEKALKASVIGYIKHEKQASISKTMSKEFVKIADKEVRIK